MLDPETKTLLHGGVTVDQTARVLPREIAVEKIHDGVRYRLPMRRIGMLCLVGLVPLAFGLVFMLIPVFWFGHFLKDAFTHPNFVHLFFALFLAFWFYGTSKLVTFGLLILAGRCKVELTRERGRRSACSPGAMSWSCNGSRPCCGTGCACRHLCD